MSKENVSQGLRLQKMEEARNYFIKKSDQNELMSKKHKIVSTTLNYIDHFLILASAISGCISFLLLLLYLLSL